MIIGTGLLFFSRSFINADTAETLTSNKAILILILSVAGICSLLVGLVALILAFVSKK
jgi:uncharacterized membrane protein